MNTKLYVEGGGNSKALRRACARGFRCFLEKEGMVDRDRKPGIVACGDRQSAYERFAIAMTSDEIPVLLVDAESSVTASDSWTHLRDHDGWTRPEGASDDQCHLMVELMEAWFLADHETLQDYYGPNFRANALPNTPNVEQIAKSDVLDALNRASRETQKGRYKKGAHSFEILGRIDPRKVRRAARHACAFLDALWLKCG